jgi:hypothetical protein
LKEWGLWIRLLFAGLMDGPCSGEAGLWTSIHGLTSGLSVTEHVFPSRHTIQTQANNGNRVQDRYNLTLNDITLLHFSRDGTQYFHTTNVAFQSQCHIRFYFEKRRNWRITFFSMFHI